MAQQERGGERFLLGINYWPRTTAMAMWTRFDIGEIDEDFSRIAAFGLHAVRFFLLWEAFQPAPREINGATLDHFEKVLECARRHGLLTMPTLFCGHMSGVNWLPSWTLDEHRPHGRFRTIAGRTESSYGAGDTYEGPLLDAQRAFVRVIGGRAKDHPSVLAWDLGNEFSNVREPSSVHAAHVWSATLADELLESSGIAVTAGTHGEDLTEDRNIRLSSLCEPFSFATMHGYPVYSAFARRPDDPEVVPFLGALAGGFSARRLFFTEFGNPTCSRDTEATSMGCLDEDAMAEYATAVLHRLQERGALGAFWWCWADYAAELKATPPFDRSPHELHFGIVRNDGTEKPVANALARFAGEKHEVIAASDRAADDETRYYAGLPHSTEDAFRRYLEAHG